VGVFANALVTAIGEDRPVGWVRNWRGAAAWILERVHRVARPSRIAVLEKISLAPRQSLALIEVDGERLLVGTSQQVQLQFHALRKSGSRIETVWERIPVEGTVE